MDFFKKCIFISFQWRKFCIFIYNIFMSAKLTCYIAWQVSICKLTNTANYFHVVFYSNLEQGECSLFDLLYFAELFLVFRPKYFPLE